MAKCLVVGGNGFIGQAIRRQLMETGRHQVYVLERYSSSAPLADGWLTADITSAESLAGALGDQTFDLVFHVASLAVDTGNPLEMVQVNLVGLANVLKHARDMAAERFVLTSSISAYGWFPATQYEAPLYQPVDEEHPIRCKDMYSSTKRMQEILGLTFCHQYRVPVSVLRLTFTIGPRGQGGGFFWRTFAEKLQAGRSVQIPHFSPHELCHYVDVRDVARMQVEVAEHPEAVGQVFNCCGPSPVHGREFADAVRRVVPGIEVEYGFPWSLAQGGSLAFDMSKAKRLLGFEPRYQVEDSIRNIKAWVDAGGLEADRPHHEPEFVGGVQS